ncbi:MAG: tetratricopeptide repeat protein [Candidatus Gastranaerophilales bacterium]|nr:tetratricopeptide repeat protein [Candidatus Gastranaerophilales bacterium]
MKDSIEEIKTLMSESDYETVISRLLPVVQSSDADFDDYFYFVDAVSSFCDRQNYPLAYQCFVLANMTTTKEDRRLAALYEKTVPIIQSLGLKFFNDNNTHKISREYYLQARFLLFVNATKYTDAVLTVTKLIDEFPSPANYAQRCKINTLQKKYKAALSDIDNAIKLMPNNADYYYNRALLKQKMNNLQGALEDFDTAINLKPDKIDYYFSRGLLEQNAERYKNALDDFKKVLQLDPQNTRAFTEISWCCFKQNRFKEAFAFSNMAIHSDPNNAGCYYVRGTILNHVRMYEEARNDLEKAVNLDNCSDKLWTSKIKYRKAWAEFNLKNYLQAEKDIIDAIKYYSRCVTYYLLAMDIEFFGLKNYLTAKEYCQEILKLDSENKRALIAQKSIAEKISDL